MQAERARIRRLRRLEQVRALARRQAASEAARAESHLVQLEALAGRTRAMLDDYRSRTSLNDGLELRQLGQFVAGLSGITATAANDAEQARTFADQMQQALATAERSRAAVEDRAKASENALARKLTSPALAARRAVGTGLE